MQGLRLKPPVSPLVLPLTAVGLTIAASVVGAVTGSHEKFLPFTTLPILALLGYWVYARSPRMVKLELRDGAIHLVGYERHALMIRPTELSLRRWVYPVLGTRQGDALVLRGVGANGQEKFVTFATAGGTSAQAVDPPCDQADISLGQAEFAKLLSLNPNIGNVREVGAEGASANEALLTVALVPHRGAAAAYGAMLPWFGTMIVVGILGALGEPLMRTTLGRVVLFGAIIAAIGGGIFYTFRRATKPKQELLLRLSSVSISVGDQRTPIFQARRADLNQRHETYVYSTKYGTFRFPVLVLSSVTQKIRIGVWEDYSTVGVALAPEGAAPEYLVSASEYRAIMQQLGR